MLALRVPASLAPVTLAFELAHGRGARVRARGGGAFAVPVGMAAGDPSVLGAPPAPNGARLRWLLERASELCALPLRSAPPRQSTLN
jgi:hypothetical protein